MYVNFFSDGTEDTYLLLVLGSFGLETALTTTLGWEKKFSLGIFVQLEVSTDSKRCRSLFELEVFQVRKLELYPGHGTICWKTLFF